MEAPERTASTLSHLQARLTASNAVQFYDNNFFLNESHAREQAERLIPLNLRWWAEGRIDTMLRYSDDTLARHSPCGRDHDFLRRGIGFG